uniref:Glycosyltransferase family 92 protein n=1 Tax=Panagrellus redivivus TaxID=6233 RepID=A0A7E4ZYZ5_PANRE
MSTRLPLCSIVILSLFLVVFYYHIYHKDVHTHIIVISATRYETSEKYPPNTVVVLFNARRAIRQVDELLCISENSTHRKLYPTKAQFAYNPTRECKFATFIAVCSSVSNARFLGFSKNRIGVTPAQLVVRPAVMTKNPVVVCFSPLFYFERWQILATSLEIYRHYGADLMVVYVQSMLAEVFALLQYYEGRGKVAIEPWSTHDIPMKDIEKLGYNPNFELDWRNQAAAHTDCVLKYRESADFIIIADIDDVLVPQLKYQYIDEFKALQRLSSIAAGFAYPRLNVVLQAASSTENFDISQILSTARISREIENHKYVLIPQKAQTAWIHWPGIVDRGSHMLRMPEKNFMLHLRNWTLDTPHLFNSNDVQLTDIMNTAIIADIHSHFKRVKKTEAYRRLPSKERYAQDIVDCYEEMFYSKKRQPQFCPGPVRCHIKPHPGVRCMVAKKVLDRTQVMDSFVIYSGYNFGAFTLYKNGCNMISTLTLVRGHLFRQILRFWCFIANFVDVPVYPAAAAMAWQRVFVWIWISAVISCASASHSNCPEGCACALLTVVCTGQALNTVPSGIPAGTIRLDLQQNQITHVYRNDFVNLTSLKYLDLSNNALEIIDDNAFAELVNLERIRLNKNKLHHLPDHLFLRMEKLNRLDLSENELEILTNAQIVGSKAMRNLQLDKNKLTCMETDVIRDWKYLEIFTLNNNRLTTLDRIDSLPNLRVFRMFENPWLCDCRMKWVKHFANASLISKVKCHRPMLLQGQNLMQVEEDDMKCSGIEKRGTASCADEKRCPAECACTATIIDCHDRSLTHIPSNLPTGIEEIRLNGNRITKVPSKAFAKLSKLKSLDLSRNQINEIAADAFEGLHKLQHLHIFHNNISELTPETFSGLTELDMLMLNANNLRCIPKDLFKDLQELRVLSIYKNKIRSIENGTFDSLKSIKALHLSENPYICDCNMAWMAEFLSQRQLLDNSGVKCAAPKRMIDMPLSRANSEMFKCKGSEYLVTKNSGQCLIDNPCPSQCTCFGAVVDCSNRGLSVIPSNLPKFTTTLLMNKNQLSEINADSGLQKLVNLEKIDLSHNNITFIHNEAFIGLAKLKELVLSNNNLINVDRDMFGAFSSSLERLHLNGNKLECVMAETFGRLPNLTLLSLADNTIKSIDFAVFAQLPQMHSIYLAGNKFVCNCDSYQFIHHLNTNGTIKVLDNASCDQPSILHGKQFYDVPHMVSCESSRKICTAAGSYCPTGCICEGTTVRCSHAGLSEFPTSLPAETTELYLNGNNITEINVSVLNGLEHLVKLDLSNNNLKVIENNIFHNLNKLDVLILNFNHIQCVEDYAFSGLTNLRILSMHGNNLSMLSELSFSNLTRTIQQIAMLNNPLYCDCNMAWFNKWISQSYVESGLSKCAAPPQLQDQLILTANPSSFVCKESAPKSILAKCNPCVDKPCNNGGTCVHGPKRSYECRCAVGYYGRNCEKEIDACYGEPCENDGRCEVTEEGRFKCHCAKGFIGGHCETNIDDCVGNKCRNGGVCVDEINSYSCDCPALYIGKFCEERIQFCTKMFNPCRNGAKCESLDEIDYKCHCEPRFTGRNCTTRLDNCQPTSCHNNGVCVSTSNGFTCQCAEGFLGEFCEIPLPSILFQGAATCNEDTCKNGECSKTEDDDFECKCHYGYDGKQCDRQSLIGFDTPNSYVSVYGYDAGAKSNLTFTLRSKNRDGILFYYGDDIQFVSAEIYDGRIRLSLSIGRNQPSLMYSYLKVNDGKSHLIRFEIDDNRATLTIDNHFPQTIINKGRTKRLELKSKQPLFFGGLPDKIANFASTEFRVKSVNSLVGCIADVFFNTNKVDFADTSVVEKRDTIVGCGPTVNICQNVGCNNAGKCVPNPIKTRGYECSCSPTYTGENCENRLPGCIKERFRVYHEDNGCRSVDMIKNARCLGYCGNENSPFEKHADGSSFGPKCCCRAVKTRHRKVRMMCPDGSRKQSSVEIVRKCQCTTCDSPLPVRF